MAKVKKPTDESVPEDSSSHAKTVHQGKYGDRGDRVYVPGEGFYLSKHAVYDMERDCRKKAEEHGERPFDDKRNHTEFISESEIESWYREIQAVKAMNAAKSKRDEQRAEYEATCYEGTDTQDPTKTGSKIFDKRNNFDLDRSGSTASLTMTSCQPAKYLNGSSVRHGSFVRLAFTSPDGRRLIEVSMTFDQLASLLVSSSHTPCTIEEYWSVTDECVRLQEVVKEPETIHARMAQRLNDRLDDMQTRLDAMTKELDEQIASGKAMSKTKLAELRRDLDVYKVHFGSNRDFTVEQAKEEVSSIVEQAAASIAWQHKLSPEELLGSPHVVALMETLAKHKALPAPEKKPEAQ